MPSILFINRVFPPDPGATGHLVADLARDFRSAGWDVTVLTSRGAAQSGIAVETIAAPLSGQTSLCLRTLGMALLFPLLLVRSLRLPRHDVVVTMTDPPMQLLLGTFVGWLKGSAHVHWCQDVYPEVVESIGIIKRKGLLANILRDLSTAVMNRAASVIAVGNCMRRVLITRGVQANKIQVIPNWAASGHNISGISAWRRKCGVADDALLIMYAGNLGRAHTFDAILEAAQRLERRGTRATFLFLGDGPVAPRVRAEIERRQIRSMHFLPRQNNMDYQKALAAADIHLACMSEKLAGLVVPSKVYATLAAGRPCLFIGPASSEVARTIEQHDVGEVFGEESGPALADAIEAYVSNPERLCAAKARAAAASHYFLREPATKAFIRAITEVLGEVQGPVADLALNPS